MTQNLKMRDEMCDGWRSGDKFPEEESSDSDISDQAKKEWLDREAVDFPSITDKKRFELFTKIPNYIEGSLAIRNVDSTLTSSDDKIAQYFPKGDYFVWTSETNLIGWRDNKKEDLKMYLENGNIVSCSPNLGNGLVWKYLGKWNY